jgi:hypothetical protein
MKSSQVKLTKAQQKALIKALPAMHKASAKQHALALHMQGHGIMDIIKSIGSFLGPIAKEVGPTVLKEFVLPFLKKKMEGNGLALPGQGLKLAGQGKPKLVKGSPEAKAHMAKLRAMRKK